MPAKKNVEIALSTTQIEGLIHVLRGQRVMLDSDLAELYGVSTGRLNESVTRNIKKFPDDFSYELTQQEFANLISQIAISSSKYGGRRTRPRVFTEHGVAMLSGVLRSETAVRINIEIIRAFVHMRRLMATPGELVSQLQQLAETVKLHDDQLRAISEALRRMLTPPPEPPKRRIGFHPLEQPPEAKS